MNIRDANARLEQAQHASNADTQPHRCTRRQDKRRPIGAVPILASNSMFFVNFAKQLGQTGRLISHGLLEYIRAGETGLSALSLTARTKASCT